MATALLLAATSFIGRHLAKELSGRQHHVVPTARRAGMFPDGAVLDLFLADDLARLVARHRPDWIIQCAGGTRTRDPRELYRLHVGVAETLLRAVRDHVPGAVVVFFGSAAEYGPVPPAELPVAESHPADPRDFFGASKLAQTQLARAAARQWNLRTLVVRPANVIGPGLGRQYLAAALAARIATLLERGDADRELAVVNAGATRDFVDARDVARAVRLLLTRARPDPGASEVYNIATGRETPVSEVARILGEVAGGGVRITDAGPGESRSDIQRSSCDSRKLALATGWKPRITAERSLADLWREMRSGGVDPLCPL